MASSFCDVNACPDNENTMIAQARERGEISKGWSLNPFKVCPPPWFRKTAVN